MRRTLRSAALIGLFAVIALAVMDTTSEACHRRRARRCHGHHQVATCCGSYGGYGGHGGGGWMYSGGSYAAGMRGVGFGAPGYGGYGAPGYGAPSYGGYGAPGYGGYGAPGVGGYGAPGFGGGFGGIPGMMGLRPGIGGIGRIR